MRKVPDKRLKGDFHEWIYVSTRGTGNAGRSFRCGFGMGQADFRIGHGSQLHADAS